MCGTRGVPTWWAAALASQKPSSTSSPGSGLVFGNWISIVPVLGDSGFHFFSGSEAAKFRRSVTCGNTSIILSLVCQTKAHPSTTLWVAGKRKLASLDTSIIFFGRIQPGGLNDQ